MRKWICGLLCAGLLTVLTGCAQTAQPLQTVEPKAAPEQVGMPNPVVEVTDATAFATLELGIDAPEGAENVRYSIISDSIAQVQFVQDGCAFTYRAAHSPDDISGVYETFDEQTQGLEVDGEDWYASIRIRTIRNGAGGALADWMYDDAWYSLYTPDSIALEMIGDLATELAEHVCPRPEAEAETTETDLAVQQMLPVLDSMTRALSMEGETDFRADNAKLLWTTLYLMGVNWGTLDARVTTQDDAILLPEEVATEWAAVLCGESRALPEIPQGGVIQHAQDEAAYRLTLSDLGNSDVQLDSYITDDTGICEVKMGLYAQDGQRLSGVDFVLVPTTDGTQAQFPMTVRSATGEKAA